MLRRGFVAAAFCSLFGLAGARWGGKRTPWNDLKDVIGPEWKKAPDRPGYWFWRKTPDDAPEIVQVSVHIGSRKAFRVFRYRIETFNVFWDHPEVMGGEWVFIKMPDWKEDRE